MQGRRIIQALAQGAGIKNRLSELIICKDITQVYA
jgi:hypothetical protein